MKSLLAPILGLALALPFAAPANAVDLVLRSWENTHHDYYNPSGGGTLATAPVVPVHVDDVTNPVAVTDGSYAARFATTGTTSFARIDAWSSELADQLKGNQLLKIDFAIANPQDNPQATRDVSFSILIKSRNADGSGYVETEHVSADWIRAKSGTAAIDYFTLFPALTAGRDEVKIEFRVQRQGGFTGSVYFDNLRVELVPEPASLGLLGLGGLVMLRRRRA